MCLCTYRHQHHFKGNTYNLDQFIELLALCIHPWMALQTEHPDFSPFPGCVTLPGVIVQMKWMLSFSILRSQSHIQKLARHLQFPT